MTRPVRFFNPETHQVESESIYGEAGLRFLYTTLAGRLVTHGLMTKRLTSQAYGSWQSSPLSRCKIAPFIQKFSIPMDQFEEGPFNSFNDFFIRRFKAGQRSFPVDPRSMGAFAEARYHAFAAMNTDTQLPIKGLRLRADQILDDDLIASRFLGGPALIARLCPVDYHRYHFPDAGKTLRSYSVQGALHSVSPIALQSNPEILVTNERRVSLLQTENFGLLAYVEVGAMMVGKIVQTHDERSKFNRGDEKGYFLFGGSTVVVLGEPGRWTPTPALCAKTSEGLETLMRLGHTLATAPN